MSSVATVDSLPETRSTLADDTTSRSNRRGRSRKRKSGDTVSTEGKNKKRTFDDFFNFCSFVLAYEEQLERQALSNPPLTAPNNHTITMTKGHTVTTHHNNSTHNFTTDLNNTTNHMHTEPTEHPPTDHHEHTTHNSTTHNHHHHTTPTSSSSSDSESGEEGERGAHSSTDEKLEYTSEDESWNLVTCFCRRPFAGRPMIECSKCSTWVHLFCAKIRKSAVPEVYTCPKCSTPPGKTSARRSAVTSAL